MSFFDDMSSKLSSAGAEAYKAAKDLAEIGKINLKISEEERRLDSMFEFLGVSVYAAYQEGKTEDYSEACREIAAQKEAVAELRRQSAALRGKKICPKCGCVSPKTDVFCGKCGRKFEEENGEEYAPEFCPNCGAKLAPGETECANCHHTIA